MVNINGTEFELSLRRKTKRPLDASSLFDTKADAEEYAANRTSGVNYCPYYGQVVGVKNDGVYWLGGMTTGADGKEHFSLQSFAGADLSDYYTKEESDYRFLDKANYEYLLSKMSVVTIDGQEAVKIDSNLVATGGISAYGEGVGGGSGQIEYKGDGKYISIGNGFTIQLDYDTLKNQLKGDIGGGGSGGATTWDELRGKPSTWSEWENYLSGTPCHSHSQYLTSGDLSSYALRSEIPDVSSFLTQDDLVNGNGISIQTYTNNYTTIGIDDDTMAKIDNGQTAHDWGNHASAGYAKLSGGAEFEDEVNVKDWLTISPCWGDFEGGIDFRGKPVGDNGYSTYITQLTAGNEALFFGTTNESTAFFFRNGVPKSDVNGWMWQSMTPAMMIANNIVTVGNALRIGNAYLTFDEVNNALRIAGPNGEVVNFYATGGVTAYY